MVGSLACHYPSKVNVPGLYYFYIRFTLSKVVDVGRKYDQKEDVEFLCRCDVLGKSKYVTEIEEGLPGQHADGNQSLYLYHN